ncbi:MAG TPA: UDP-3-O-acyl-N-acetylglucosamine deacetylase [Candidatus Tectomicrobia bacterium]|nr:UDP-3-O-acyl-N-acetylglucosamine deacetylase [Candidatus Tectomicrobia bacterium]
MRQHTIRRQASLAGIGLHSGKRAEVTVRPAPANSGIVFRAGFDGAPIPAAPESVVDCHYATTIGSGDVRIQTIEHLMAAAAGLGIDNLEVVVDGPEIPAMDGSAKPFVGLLAGAGRQAQHARRRPIDVPHPIRVGRDGRWLHLVPADTFRISYTLDNDHPAIGLQTLVWTPTEESFITECAPARTYGFLKDLGFLRKSGRALGGSLDNTIVLGKSGTLNGLRFRDEFVRHKVLDLIGDLALLGRPLRAHVVARNAGHALNLELVVAVQRALGLDRRPAGGAVRVMPVLDSDRAETLSPAPAGV